MRVLHVMPGVNPSAGAERSFAHLAPILIARGVGVHLAVLTERQGLVPQLERAGVVVHDASAAGSMLSRYRALCRILDAVNPDIVHASLWEAAVPAQMAARRQRVPIVVTWAAVGSSIGYSTTVPAWKLGAVRWADRALARISGCWFQAVTEGVAQENGRALRVAPRRIRVVERGRPELSASKCPLDDLRAELDIDCDDRVILAVGRHEPVKDHVTLVRAAAVARRSIPRLRVLIAGRDGTSSTALRSEIERLGLDDAVKLLGQRDDVGCLLLLADVFAMTSQSEGAAGAVIEAFRAGTPVVATDVAGQRGILVHGHNALVVPVSSPMELASSLLEVLENPSLARRISAVGRSTYEQRFTMSRSGDAMLDLYRDVVAHAQKSSRSP